MAAERIEEEEEENGPALVTGHTLHAVYDPEFTSQSTQPLSITQLTTFQGRRKLEEPLPSPAPSTDPAREEDLHRMFSEWRWIVAGTALQNTGS